MKLYFIMDIAQWYKIDYLRIEIHLKTYKKINTACLGCFPVECELNTEVSTEVEYTIELIKKSKLLRNLSNTDKFIFNTNCFIPVNEFTTSTINITSPISASIEKNNLFGVQFNPEKSGGAGMKILQNFFES